MDGVDGRATPSPSWPTYDVLLGIDILAPLGLTMTLNAIRIFPPPRNSRGACAIEGPISRDNLKPEERSRVEVFLKSQLKRLHANKGVTPLIEHEIRLEDVRPIRQTFRPRNPATQRIIYEEVDKMLQQGVIQPSNSPWSSPIVMTRRKDGKPRFCVDFRSLNKVSKKDAYPLPQVNATLDKQRGARYLSSIDLKNGYWYVPLTERSKPLTAFTVPGKGLFKDSSSRSCLSGYMLLPPSSNASSTESSHLAWPQTLSPT